jgi:hypothetical protein
MAISITANGIINTATTWSIRQNTSTEVQKVNASGLVLKNNKPTWRAYPTSGTGTGAVWASYVAQHNSTGSGFNASTGRFTAPAAGVYVLSMWGITASAGNTDIRHSMMKNGNTNASHCISSSNGGSYSPTNVTNVWYLAAGDYVECTVYQGGVAHSGDWNGFSGYYVG